jgi:U4/U6.U5 tri-snRNP component SNU23
MKREKWKDAKKRKRAVEIKAEEGVGGQADAAREEEDVVMDDDAAMMARMMGFSGGFGTTKKN